MGLALVSGAELCMATTREKSARADILRAALLAKARQCIEFNHQVTNRVNQIFGGKLFADELEKLSSSISALLMNGDRQGDQVARSTEKQRDAALAILDDPRLMEVLKTRPTTMWEEIIIEKMAAAQLRILQASSTTSERD